METMGAVDFSLMGQVATFDVVTFYGLVCAGIFSIGFVVARYLETRRLAARGHIGSE